MSHTTFSFLFPQGIYDDFSYFVPLQDIFTPHYIHTDFFSKVSPLRAYIRKKSLKCCRLFLIFHNLLPPKRYIRIKIPKCLTKNQNICLIAYIPRNLQKCRKYFLSKAYIPGFSKKCRNFFIFPATNQEKKSYIRIESATLSKKIRYIHSGSGTLSRKKLYIRSRKTIFLKKIPTLSAFLRNIHIKGISLTCLEECYRGVV